MQGASLKLDSNVFNGKFGTILDSGTTYAYLPDRAFEAFTDAVSEPAFLIFFCVACCSTL